MKLSESPEITEIHENEIENSNLIFKFENMKINPHNGPFFVDLMEGINL
jgi:hypothetical protein